MGHGLKPSFDHRHKKLQEQELSQGDNKEKKIIRNANLRLTQDLKHKYIRKKHNIC